MQPPALKPDLQIKLPSVSQTDKKRRHQQLAVAVVTDPGKEAAALSDTIENTRKMKKENVYAYLEIVQLLHDCAFRDGGCAAAALGGTVNTNVDAARKYNSEPAVKLPTV